MSEATMREHDLARDVKAVLRDIEALLAAVNEQPQGVAIPTPPRLETGIRDARSRLAELDAALAARARRAAAGAEDYARRHPWEVAAAAAAAGAMVGAMLGAAAACLYGRR
jgi:ElaB/YqjD/DUF883 family membrane-anchored ribosome-binding protein